MFFNNHWSRTRHMQAGIGILEFFGIDRRRAHWGDRLISGVGGFLAIFAILHVSELLLADEAILIVASMGASAVLLFAVPTGPLSQPWALIGGHLVSAAVGVSCARWLGVGYASAAFAVGFAIGGMHMLRCIHPPGGATALSAVLSGPGVHALGYDFLLTPVMLNVAIILLVALSFNAPFPWRRYPAVLAAMAKVRAEPLSATSQTISHADLVYALSEMETFVDVSEQDLQRIYEIATGHVEVSENMAPESVKPGQCYSNGRYGSDWQVREVLSVEQAEAQGHSVVTFRIVAGIRRRRVSKSGLPEFTRWAAYPVERIENSWRRLSKENEKRNQIKSNSAANTDGHTNLRAD